MNDDWGCDGIPGEGIQKLDSNGICAQIFLEIPIIRIPIRTGTSPVGDRRWISLC